MMMSLDKIRQIADIQISAIANLEYEQTLVSATLVS